MPLFRAKAKLSRQLLSYDYFINMKLQQRKNMCVCVCVCVYVCFNNHYNGLLKQDGGLLISE